MEIDRNLLTEDQRKDLDAWTELFHGKHWPRLLERYEGRIEGLQNAYATVNDQNSLGRIQGALHAYRDIFLILPDVINYEFLIMTGQVEGMEEGREGADDPVTPPDWSH